jgi:hypothetical protein
MFTSLDMFGLWTWRDPCQRRNIDFLTNFRFLPPSKARVDPGGYYEDTGSVLVTMTILTTDCKGCILKMDHCNNFIISPIQNYWMLVRRIWPSHLFFSIPPNTAQHRWKEKRGFKIVTKCDGHTRRADHFHIHKFKPHIEMLAGP